MHFSASLRVPSSSSPTSSFEYNVRLTGLSPSRLLSFESSNDCENISKAKEQITLEEAEEAPATKHAHAQNSHDLSQGGVIHVHRIDYEGC